MYRCGDSKSAPHQKGIKGGNKQYKEIKTEGDNRKMAAKTEEKEDKEKADAELIKRNQTKKRTCKQIHMNMRVQRLQYLFLSRKQPAKRVEALRELSDTKERQVRCGIRSVSSQTKETGIPIRVSICFLSVYFAINAFFPFT